MLWIGTYQAVTPGVDFGDNVTLRLDADNEVQPDAFLRIESTAGGASHVSDDHYLEGAPELIVEIAASSASYDLHDKMHVYRRNGVQEYVVWRVYDEAVDWFQLQEGRYIRMDPDEDGLIRSQVFSGLCLDVSALLAGDLAKALAAVKASTETEEHAAFVQRLAEGL
jgi:Uma2 family endonuclease